MALSNKLTFDETVAMLRGDMRKAMEKQATATLALGSVTQRMACVITEYYNAVVAHGEDVALWSALLDRSGEAYKAFSKDVLAAIYVPATLKDSATKVQIADAAADKRRAQNMIADGIELAHAMHTLHIKPEDLNEKTGLLSVNVATLLPLGYVLDTIAHNKVTMMPIDGKAMLAAKPGEGDSMIPVKIVRNKALLIKLAQGTYDEKRGADATKKGGGVSEKNAERILKDVPAKEQAAAVSNAAKAIVLADADFAALLRAVAKQLRAIDSKDAAPITPGTYDKATVSALRSIAEYYNGTVAPALSGGTEQKAA